MLKLKRIGISEIKPFPTWPPLVAYSIENNDELVSLLTMPSNNLIDSLNSLGKDKAFEYVMTTLSVLYAYFFDYIDAPDVSDIENGEPNLFRVKHILENYMIHDIFKVHLPECLTNNISQNEMANYLEKLSLNNQGVRHPFYDYVQMEMNYDQMKEFLWLEVIRNEVVDDEVAMLIPGLQHSMKQVVASNLWDECGNGKIDNFHTTWLLKLISYDDQLDEFLDYRINRPWFSSITSNSFNSLLTNPSKRYMAYGTFLINESWVADHFECILKGMDRLNISDYDRRIYFEAHYKIDQHHRLEMIEGLRQQSPQLSKKRLLEVAFGAHQAINAGTLMYDKLLNYFTKNR